LHSVRFTENPDKGPFPNTGVHVVEVNPVLVHRLKIASVWLRIEQDVRLGSGDASHTKALSTDEGQAFESSSGLYSGVMLFDAYVSPLLAAGTPGIWAVNVVRSFGSLIFDLGTFISGTEADAAEMLQLISTPRRKRRRSFPQAIRCGGRQRHPMGDRAPQPSLRGSERSLDLHGCLSWLSPGEAPRSPSHR
jgi:hypothetical protein